MKNRWRMNAERITNQLAEMVSIDSVNPDLVAGAAGEQFMADWMVQTCEGFGLEVWVQEIAPKRSNVIARWPGKGNGKSLLLTGHMDVVSVDGMEQPFVPRIEEGRLYGRGSFDMKGGLASILGAVAALQDGGFQPQGDLFLGFVVDEEYKSIGTEALVKEIQPDAAILTEPTDMEICTAHKGFVWLTLDTKGHAAHGSVYEDGIDAIAHAGRLLRALETMERETLPQKTHPLLDRPSVHASVIAGGLGPSTYPDRCTLQVEHRTLPGETEGQVIALWQKIIQRLHKEDPQFSAEIVVDFVRSGYEIERSAPVVQTLHQAFTNVSGKGPVYWGNSGWLDSAILGEAGIPTVIIGPSGAGAHAAVEYVELESVHQCAAILAEAASQWTGS